MSTFRRFLIRVAASASGRRDRNRVRTEIEEHLALQAAEYVRAGFSSAEARRRAVLKFGSPHAVEERCHDAQGVPAVDQVLQDTRYTLRQFRRTPLFTLTATLSLSVGIGASAAVFMVIEHIFLRSLSVSKPQELVFVTDQRSQLEDSPRFSYPFYVSLRDNQVLKGTAALFSLPLSAAHNGQVSRVRGALVSGNYFSVVRPSMHIGRPLTPDDDKVPGAHPVAVISQGFWRRTFGSDVSALGSSLRLNEHVFTIVGVAGRGFTGTDVGSPTDIWLPMTMQREVGRNLLTDVRTNWLEIIGRVDPDVGLERAGAELTAYLDRHASSFQTQSPGRRLILLPGGKGHSLIRRELGPALRVLMALTGLAMVLACVNVANLLTLRSAAREKEIAVRVALGAGHSRLSRQFLTETLVLAAIAGGGALLIAPWAARLLVAAQPQQLEIDTGLSPLVLVFTLATSLAAALIVAIAPIFGCRKVAVNDFLGNASSAASAAPASARIRDFVVTLQIALSVVMLVAASLLLQSFRDLRSIDPGFRADNLLLVTMDPASAGYQGERLQRFWRDAVERVAQASGVQSVSLAGTVPLEPRRQRQPWFSPASGEVLEIDTNFVGAGYFRTLDVPVLQGREFDERDTRTARAVVAVNERLARMFWPGQDPVGKGVRMAGGEKLAEVVGVVRDVKYHDLRADYSPMVYRPLSQAGSSDPMTLHVRASADPAALVWTIRSEMQILDAHVPVYRVATLDDVLDVSFAQTRQAAGLTGALGLLALVLSGIGTYGVTALAASRRTREVGIRMALGAQRRQILSLIGRRGIVLTAAGVTVGLLCSLAVVPVAGALLYGVTPSSSVATLAGTAALVGLVAVTGFCIPLRAATHLDVHAALRYE